jgi:hypothetical protein
MIGNKKTKYEVNVKKEVQEERTLKYIGTKKQHENHTLFKIDIKTGEVSGANYVKKPWIFNGENKLEILIEEGYEYVSALNEQNALKKLREGKSGFKESVANPIKL